MSLFPTFDVPEVTDQESQLELKKSWKFDFEKGEFVTDGSGMVQQADEWTAWAQWCMKVIVTQRFACLAYSQDIGIEFDDIIDQTTRKGAETVFEQTATEALRVHPNTESVLNFTFTWNGDGLAATFVVNPIEGDPLEINSFIKL